ncbi:MAG: flagellar FlbD family protein [Planctomycetes bacterium]|nr:flagellar FlbD family protein [Planctomycetota bacterium]
MIKLTQLGGDAFILNAELIRYVESRPDTFVTLTTGERLIVRESMDEVMRRAIEYQRAKHLIPTPHYPAVCTAPAGAVADRPRSTATIR